MPIRKIKGGKMKKIKKSLIKGIRRKVIRKMGTSRVNKAAFISDIHGNLEAFLAVLKDIIKEDVDKIYCLGDVIGYGANPNESLELIKELKIDCVRGNHEEALIKNECCFTEMALQSIKWTAGVLSEKNYSSLDSFPYLLKCKAGDKSFTIVHGSNDDPADFKYIDNVFLAGRSIYKQKLCFTGHSHDPLLFFTGDFLGEKRVFCDRTNMDVIIKKDMNCIVNVGSVGQPRDKDARACYSIYDLNKNTISWKRVKYDIKKAQDKILKTDLPELCAARLDYGN